MANNYQGSITLATVQNGHDGQSGTSYYTYIKYATDSSGASMSDSPDNRDYMGVYTGTDSSAPSTPSSYTWSKYVGEQGEPGADGKTWNIETNIDQSFKYYGKDGVNNEESLRVTNTTFAFKVKEIKNNTTTTLVPGTNYTYKIKLIKNISGDSNYTYDDLGSFFESIIIESGTLKAHVLQESNNEIIFYIQESYLQSPTNSTTEVNKAKYSDYCKTCMEADVTFLVTIYDTNNNLVLIKPLFFNFSTTLDGAKFSVNCADITAAINNAGFRFSGDGLAISNGGFYIKNQSDENLLSYTPYVDGEGGQLKIEGNAIFSGELQAATGTFSGRLNAATGSFSGEIQADSGKIGGFTIAEDKLISTGGNIQLLGTDGKIIADDIEIGTGASIVNYIQLGQAFIYNPFENEGKFLKAGTVELTQGGVLSLGANGRISGGEGFSIDEYTAIFNNIVAKGKISTSVFEYSRIQSVGGIMLFKPSFKVSSVNNSIITLDSSVDNIIFTDDFVQLIGSNGSEIGVYKVNGVSGQTVTLISTNALPENAFILNVLGKAKGEGIDPGLIIGVNTNNDNASGLYGKGITFSELKEESSIGDTLSNSVNLRTFLGDLAKVGKTDLKGYGLYSDNVYLTGSLVTEVPASSSDTTYAGVNTLDGVLSEVDDENHRPIVFWAGASANLSEAIQKAPFQVTDSGHLYASNGHFTGSILVDSIIRGAEIYTANIHGSYDNNTGLNLFDSTSINFYKETKDSSGQVTSSSKIFFIDSEGFKTDESAFITISSDSVSGSFKQLKISNGTNVIKLEQDKIYGGTTGDQDTFNQYISLSNNKFDFSVNSTSYLEVGNRTTIYLDAAVKKDLYMGSSEIMHYELAYSGSDEIGYNLYVGG